MSSKTPWEMPPPVEGDEMRPLPSHYQYCFGCGNDHPTGLHLQMSGGGNRVEGHFVVTEHHQGAPGLAHGGVIAAAMDEGMGFVLYLLATPAVTARIEVDFRRPVPVGSTLELLGVIDQVEGRKIWVRMTGSLDGEVAVRSQALFLKVGVEHFLPHAKKFGDEHMERPYNP
ncbi:MAG TPA: PaaI family thioesterase [Actinomycetota bacterium]|nr:PaaI family thioesterase [Actinomycetota bacterium]